jgi:hypothetical protein
MGYQAEARVPTFPRDGWSRLQHGEIGQALAKRLGVLTRISTTTATKLDDQVHANAGQVLGLLASPPFEYIVVMILDNAAVRSRRPRIPYATSSPPAVDYHHGVLHVECVSRLPPCLPLWDAEEITRLETQKIFIILRPLSLMGSYCDHALSSRIVHIVLTKSSCMSRHRRPRPSFRHCIRAMHAFRHWVTRLLCSDTL